MKTKQKIHTDQLNFYYTDFQALKNISIGFDQNQVSALIGPSGCGKSTFLRCLNRMNDLVPGTRVEGEILLDDDDIYASSIDVVHLRSRVGMVFQKPNPFPKSIFENVAYGLRIQGISDKNHLTEKVEKSLTR
ncbi:ATP-binding cassette domain-containing protein, partial [bacterium]|nr:ATP-binding cassette domain-containing protein [bacterium]